LTLPKYAYIGRDTQTEIQAGKQIRS